MILRPRLHWFRMLFVWRGSVLGRILPQLFVIIALALGVVWIRKAAPDLLPDLTPTPFTLLGIALAIFLGFRNSVSYDRYWEGRKIWGAILNDSRSVARQFATALDADPEANKRFIYTLIAFIRSLKAQLRGTDAGQAIQGLLRPDVTDRILQARFKPAMLLMDMGEQLRSLRTQRLVSPVLFASMDRHLSELTVSLGSCERIASTPVPFPYSVILHRTVYLYSFLLPFGLAATIGIMTPVIVAFVAYTFLALEALAEELQEPFGLEPNDLPLDAMAGMIEATLREMLGEAAEPPAALPVDYVLT